MIWMFPFDRAVQAAAARSWNQIWDFERRDFCAALIRGSKERRWTTINGFSFYLSFMLVNKESVGFRLKGRFEGVILCSERCFFHGDAVVEAAVCVKEETIVCSSGSHVSSQYGAPNLDEICARHLEPEVGEVEKKKRTIHLTGETFYSLSLAHKPNRKHHHYSHLKRSFCWLELFIYAVFLFCECVCVCVCVCVFLFDSISSFWKQTCPPVCRWRSSQ